MALLRTEAGRDPYNRELTDLVGELATRSEEFRSRWAAHNVRLHRAGTKRFHHPVVGDVELAFDALELPGEPGLTLTAYTAEPGLADRGRPRAAGQLGGHRSRRHLARFQPGVVPSFRSGWPSETG